MLPVLDVDGEHDRGLDADPVALDSRFPDPPLLAPDPMVASQQRQLEDWADESFLWYLMKYRRMAIGAVQRRCRCGESADAPPRGERCGRLRRIGAWLRAGGTWERPITGLQRELGQRLDDLVNFLGARPFFYADRLSMADLGVYGMLVHDARDSIPGSARLLAARPTLVGFMARVEDATDGAARAAVTRAEKARRIARDPRRLYPRRRRSRSTTTIPFTLLVAVVALGAVHRRAREPGHAGAVRARAARPRRWRKLPGREIQRLIRSCGLAPAKAKALARAVAQLAGRAARRPRARATCDALEALPGVGHKTASVVMAQAFGVPAFPVDTHIHRLAGALGALARRATSSETERDLKRALPARATGASVHLQIIYFGREHCPARGHDLRACPICSWAASKARIAREMPTGSRRRTPSPSARRDRRRRDSAR